VDQKTEGLLGAPARLPPPLTAPEAEGVKGDDNNNTAGQVTAVAAPEAAGGAPAYMQSTIVSYIGAEMPSVRRRIEITILLLEYNVELYMIVIVFYL
jgi:hypothetical protein